MAPQVGFEPTTLRLTAECSTIELLRSKAGTLSLKQTRPVLSNAAPPPRKLYRYSRRAPYPSAIYTRFPPFHLLATSTFARLAIGLLRSIGYHIPVLKMSDFLRPIEVLLVEDNPGDVRLTQEALKEGRVINHLNVVRDGVEATDFLWRRGKYTSAPRPDLILLDLNLPRKTGNEVLQEIKTDPSLRRIPVMILTTSKAEQDLHPSLQLARQLLHRQTGRPRSVSRCGPFH